MNPFEVHLPTHIYFGNEKRESFFDHLKTLGKSAMIVIGGGKLKICSRIGCRGRMLDLI